MYSLATSWNPTVLRFVRFIAVKEIGMSLARLSSESDSDQQARQARSAARRLCAKRARSNGQRKSTSADVFDPSIVQPSASAPLRELRPKRGAKYWPQRQFPQRCREYTIALSQPLSPKTCRRSQSKFNFFPIKKSNSKMTLQGGGVASTRREP